MKRCTSCGRRKPLRAFSRWGQAYGGKRRPECKACLVERERRRGEASRQWIRDYAAGWRRENRELIDSANGFVKSGGLTTYYRLRHEAILAYGGYRCACCGIEEALFLTIDHVHNDGTRHRREVGVSGFYRWLKDRSYPSGFQVLCSNCNSGRHRNHGLCPHQDPVRKPRPERRKPGLKR